MTPLIKPQNNISWISCIENLFIYFVQAKSLGEHEWRSQQLGVLGGHHFESDTEMSDIDDDDRETLFSSMDLLSPSGHSDAQTLAMMLQEQLDAINKEIRYRNHICTTGDVICTSIRLIPRRKIVILRN